MPQPFFVHPLADVEADVEIGEGTKIWRFAHVRCGARVGANCILGNCVYIDAGVSVGNNVKIQNGVSVYAGVTVEDDAFLGPHMTFTNDLYPRSFNGQWTAIPTRVARGASIGANATILCGTTIGEYSMVAAGAVVTRDVPPYALVRGAPARVVGYVCMCGRKATGFPVDEGLYGARIPCECGRVNGISADGLFVPG